MKRLLLVCLTMLFATEAFAVDTDADGVPDTVDNCTNVSNPNQKDGDHDGYGNACDFQFRTVADHRLGAEGDMLSGFTANPGIGTNNCGDTIPFFAHAGGTAVTACAGYDLNENGSIENTPGSYNGQAGHGDFDALYNAAVAAGGTNSYPYGPFDTNSFAAQSKCATCPIACNDGKDNGDGDGLADYPTDPQCNTPLDPTEGTDNDGWPLADSSGENPLKTGYVHTGVSLTSYGAGPRYVLSTPNVTIDSKSFSCTDLGDGEPCVSIQANNVHLTRFLVTANSDPNNTDLGHDNSGIRVEDGYTGAVIEDGEIKSISDSQSGDPAWCPSCMGRAVILNGSGRVERVWGHLTQTGPIFGNGSVYRYNRFEDKQNAIYDVAHLDPGDYPHADGIGSNGGDSGVVVEFNYIECGKNGIDAGCSSGISLYQDLGANDHIRFEGNRIAANAQTCAHTALGIADDEENVSDYIEWKHNRFADDSYDLCGESGECVTGAESAPHSSSVDNRFLVVGGGSNGTVSNQDAACDWP